MKRTLLLVAIFWTAFGVRTTGSKALNLRRDPVPLRTPFSLLPMEICGPGWAGENIPLDEDVKTRARVSTYVQRSYRRDSAILWLYVGYVDHWAPESIHHPDICFPGGGYEQIMKGLVTIPAPGVLPDLRFNEYLWNHPRGGGTYTLSSFYYDGKLEPEEWHLRWDSLGGIKYFAVITISGTQVGSIAETRRVYQQVALRALPEILKHFEPCPLR